MTRTRTAGGKGEVGARSAYGEGARSRMKTSDFDYELPEELIALRPAPERGASRMLVLERRSGCLRHLSFGDLPSFVEPGDVLVLNDTKVVPARLRAVRLGPDGERRAPVEVLFVERLGERVWSVLLRKPREGERLLFEGGMEGVLRADRRGGGEWLCETDRDPLPVMERYGMMPLPPYIRRSPSAEDREWYQTVYARCRGAVAAPTAGLHFGRPMLRGLAERGVRIGYLTLHVGPGTFTPVRGEDVASHRMHPEFRRVPAETAAMVNEARARGRRVLAVGTTVVRALESAAGPSGVVEPVEGWTDLFIVPGFEFRVVGAMLTNFHLPRSTLLMLVAAFAGRETVLRAYEEAVRERYRFLSYGDAMLIL